MEGSGPEGITAGQSCGWVQNVEVEVKVGRTWREYLCIWQKKKKREKTESTQARKCKLCLRNSKSLSLLAGKYSVGEY